MQDVNLTDDELWRAIAENTNAMSALVHEQLTLNESATPKNRNRRAQLMYAQTISKYQREYREYTAELRRRHPSPSKTHDYADVCDQKETPTLRSGLPAEAGSL